MFLFYEDINLLSGNLLYWKSFDNELCAVLYRRVKVVDKGHNCRHIIFQEVETGVGPSIKCVGNLARKHPTE